MSLLLCLTLVLCGTVYAGANELQEAVPAAEKRGRLEQVFEAELVNVAAPAEKNVAVTKDLVDMDGNAYQVLELSPTGYMIYHEASGTFPEYGPEAPSPYGGYETGLYYFGPMEYYAKTGDTLTHTITGEELSIPEYGAALEEASAELVEHYNENADALVLDYIEGAADTLPLKRGARAGEKYIPGQAQINNMVSKSEMSYCSPGGTRGICGYVAAAITLAWYDTYKNGAIIDNATYFH